LRDTDLTWLNKKYQKMYELFKDAPAFQWMEESVRQEERKKALAERKQTLATLRQTVIEMVSQRFPRLKRLAQMNMLDSTERFSQVILRLSLASNADEVQDILLSLPEKEDAEQTPEP
jgi:hypothetical protein